jgi:SAM-dependent methyltransferase
MSISTSENWEPLGQAMLDYFNGNSMAAVVVKSTVEEDRTVPLSNFFRTVPLPVLEKIALKKVRGKVLDAGAGAGTHALLLQKRGVDISALDISYSACKVMQQRGLKKVFQGDIFKFNDMKFDTIMLLMNGIGLCETLKGLPELLQHFNKILLPSGQVICDSTDIAYVKRESRIRATLSAPINPAYYGEIWYQLSYKNLPGEPYPWLFVDKNSLKEAAIQSGFNCEIIAKSGEQYLARLLKVK